MDQMREELHAVREDANFIQRYCHSGSSSTYIKRIIATQISVNGPFHASVQGALVEAGWDEELQEFHPDDHPDWGSLDRRLDRLLTTMESSLKSTEMLECTESMGGNGGDAEVIDISRATSED